MPSETTEVVPHTQVIAVHFAVADQNEPQYVPELESYIRRIGGKLVFGDTADECNLRAAEQIHMNATTCPHCGARSYTRVCPCCHLDCEWFESEAGAMQAEHIRHGQA